MKSKAKIAAVLFTLSFIFMITAIVGLFSSFGVTGRTITSGTIGFEVVQGPTHFIDNPEDIT